MITSDNENVSQPLYKGLTFPSVLPSKMIVTIKYELDDGYLTVVVEVSHGGYCGKFYFDHNMNYLGAFESFNPP